MEYNSGVYELTWMFQNFGKHEELQEGEEIEATKNLYLTGGINQENKDRTRLRIQ